MSILADFGFEVSPETETNFGRYRNSTEIIVSAVTETKFYVSVVHEIFLFRKNNILPISICLWHHSCKSDPIEVGRR